LHITLLPKKSTKERAAPGTQFAEVLATVYTVRCLCFVCTTDSIERRRLFFLPKSDTLLIAPKLNSIRPSLSYSCIQCRGGTVLPLSARVGRYYAEWSLPDGTENEEQRARDCVGCVLELFCIFLCM